jgi:hypothetical protein
MQLEQNSVQKTVGHVARSYKGPGAEGGRWRIPEHQRDYVWKYDRQNGLIDSIMRGYVIPPLMLHEYEPGRFDIEDGQQRVHTIFLYTQNRFGWKRDDGPAVYYNDEGEVSMTESERQKFNSHPLYTIQFANATMEQISDIFERLNSGKSLSDNDKFWNRRDTPLIQFVKQTLFGSHLERVQAVFTDKVKFSRGNLSNAVGMIAACMYGRDFITTSFSRLLQGGVLKEPVTAAAERRCLRRLDRLLSLYESVDALSPYPVQKLLSSKTPAGKLRYAKADTKKKEQFTLGKFSAYYIFDLIVGDGERPDADDRDDEWRQFLMSCRDAEYYKYDNKLKGEGGGANNINAAKLEAGIKKFDKYAANHFEDLGEGQEDDYEDDDDESV